MKIIAISGSEIPSINANSIQTMKAVHALAMVGHDVRLIVPFGSQQHHQSTWKDLAHIYGLSREFEIEYLPSPSRRLFFFAASRRAKKLKPDLLYVWPVQSAVLGLFMNLPVVLEMHDLPSGRIGPLWFRYFRDGKGKKRIAAITQALRNKLADIYGEPNTEMDCVIAPNGVELERFASLPDVTTARFQTGLAEAPTVMCTGHLYDGRGVETFLFLAEQFRGQGIQFVWAGGNKADVDVWREKAAGLPNVIFTGFIPNHELPLYQAAADILLMPYGKQIGISSGKGNSAVISSPMKMFEYLASGRAIISSNLPVFHEVLGNTTAIFCPPDDLTAWKDAVQSLLDDPQKRQAMSASARQESIKYSWTERAKRILEGF